MATFTRVRRRWESLMSIGAYPGETNIQQGKRRIVVGYLFLGALVRLIFSALNLDGGEPQIGAVLLSFALISYLIRQSGTTLEPWAHDANA